MGSMPMVAPGIVARPSCGRSLPMGFLMTQRDYLARIAAQPGCDRPMRMPPMGGYAVPDPPLDIGYTMLGSTVVIVNGGATRVRTYHPNRVLWVISIRETLSVP